jgi:hypothetical protein
MHPEERISNLYYHCGKKSDKPILKFKKDQIYTVKNLHDTCFLS